MAGYGTDSGFTAWLADNGYSLPDGAPAPAVLRQRGSQYIDALYGSRFMGYPTGGAAQERAWPRTGVFAFGGVLPSDEVPLAVVQAAYAASLAASAFSGSLTLANSAPVKRRKVGDVETEFSDASAGFEWSGDVPATVLDGLLAPFLLSKSNIMIRSVG